jgi:hypothetical protein
LHIVGAARYRWFRSRIRAPSTREVSCACCVSQPISTQPFFTQRGLLRSLLEPLGGFCSNPARAQVERERKRDSPLPAPEATSPLASTETRYAAGVTSVWDAFLGCGVMSWFCLLAALLTSVTSMIGVGVALVHLRWARAFCWVALALSLLPAGLGVVGLELGRTHVDDVLASGVVEPSARESVREVGYAEASGCLSVGATLSAAPLLMAAIALGLAYGLRGPAE